MADTAPKLEYDPEKYFRAFMNAQDALMIFDARTRRFESVNDAFMKCFGYAADAACTLQLDDILAQEGRQAALTILHAKTDGSSLPTIRFQTRNGTAFTGEAAFAHFRIGQSRKVIGCVRDVTRRLDPEGALKKAEADLRISQELLHQAQKMEALGTLVSGVAHEINNPINLIMYSMPVLKRVWMDFLPLFEQMAADRPGRTFGGLTYDYLNENLGQILSDAELAADRIAKIVGDLKNFAKQTSIEDTSPVQINRAVENALRLAQTTIRKSDVDLEIDLEPNIPVLEGNLQSIEQIVLNLTINAIQAIDHDQGRIRVATRYDTKSGDIRLTVADNGRGIRPAIAEKLFDPFVTDKQNEGGTGLGLSVTYSLVKAHNGTIGFKTAENRGTTFTVEFPSTLKPRESKILVVDDHDMVRDVLVTALKRNRGYIVDEAADGINACIKLGSFKPDLLILDIFMPEMNGLEVCRVIRSDADLADLKVIITTGHPEHRLLDEVARLGFENVLIKPIEIHKLMAVVESLLKR